MKTLVIYDSMYGNTEKLARAIAERLGSQSVLRAEDVATSDLVTCDLVIVGGPTHVHGMSAPMRGFVEGLSRHALLDVSAAAFDTRLSGAALLTGSAAHGIARHLRHAGANLIASPESFFVVSTAEPEETHLKDGELERARAWATALLHEVTVARESTAPATSMTN